MTHLLSGEVLNLLLLFTLWTCHCELKHASTAPSAGHSHQLFHVCGILGTHFQMKAIEEDMVTRRPWLLEHSIPVTFTNSVGATLFCVVLNLTIIILYSLPLLSASVCHEKKNGKGPNKASAKVCPCYWISGFLGHGWGIPAAHKKCEKSALWVI